MKTLLPFLALVSNAAMVGLEGYVLIRLSNRRDTLKYYTYLSNLLAMAGSAVFVVCSCLSLLQGKSTPIWLKGIRFSTTYMLLTTFFVYKLMGLRQKNVMTEKDFRGILPDTADRILHDFCPIISAASLLLAERQPILTDTVWTLYAAIPTIIYWAVYLFLTATGLWNDPYGFSQPQEKTGIFVFLLIPVLSMGLDHLLWLLCTLQI